MFSEQYRRDNEKLHAKETLLMEIKRETQEDTRRSKDRVRYTRYAAAAAAVVLVLAGTLGFLLGRGNAKALLQVKGAAGEQAVLASDYASAPGVPEDAMMHAEETAAEAPAEPAAEAEDTVTTPDSYDTLYALMDAYVEKRSDADQFMTGTAKDMTTAENGVVMESAAAAPTATADMGGSGGADHSETNVQVEGVDEADIVKTDGRYIYYATGDRLVILEADGKDTVQLSQTQLAGDGTWWGYASEMFLAGDRLLLITQGMSVVRIEKGGNSYDDNRDETQVRIYDVADRTNPTLLSTLAQSGSYVSSRMTDGMVYIVTTHYVWQPVRTLPETFVPGIKADGVAKTVAAEDIYVYGSPQNMAYTVIGAVDIEKEKAFAGVKAVFGSTGELYCSGENLLLACSEYDENASGIAQDENGRNVQVTTSRSYTKLMLFTLSDGKIAMTANGSVPGTLINQFAMDEYKGVFRIVTSTHEWTQRIYTDGVDTYEYEDSNVNGLYTFDGKLQPLGKLDGLAPDEFVRSVRFDGDIAYFVTFRQVDPLFTVDLSDPKAPALLSALKIPGFSEYLHVYGNGRLLGIGYAADEKTGGMQGVKLSMFDTSDKKNVAELNTARIDANWTVVGGNHKAILVDADNGLIAFPADSAYYIYTYDERNGFTELARVEMTVDLYSWNLRGLFIGGNFYVLSDSAVTVISMQDWQPVGSLVF